MGGILIYLAWQGLIWIESKSALGVNIVMLQNGDVMGGDLAGFHYFQDELEKSRHELEDMDMEVAQMKAVSNLDSLHKSVDFVPNPIV